MISATAIQEMRIDYFLRRGFAWGKSGHRDNYRLWVQEWLVCCDKAYAEAYRLRPCMGDERCRLYRVS